MSAAKPRYRWTAEGPALKALPRPQTPYTASAWLKAHGVAVADLASLNNLPRLVLVDLLRGRLRGHRGQAHRAAIVLGLKPDPDATPEVAA